jgi:hypothetical protein
LIYLLILFRFNLALGRQRWKPEKRKALRSYREKDQSRLNSSLFVFVVHDYEAGRLDPFQQILGRCSEVSTPLGRVVEHFGSIADPT